MLHLVSRINSLSSLHQPHSSLSVSDLPVPASTTSHSVNSPLSPSGTPSLFYSRLKTVTYPFHKSFIFPTINPLSGLRTDSTDFMIGLFLLSISVFCFYPITLCLLVPCGRLSWLYISFWVHVNVVYRIISHICKFSTKYVHKWFNVELCVKSTAYLLILERRVFQVCLTVQVCRAWCSRWCQIRSWCSR